MALLYFIRVNGRRFEALGLRCSEFGIVRLRKFKGSLLHRCSESRVDEDEDDGEYDDQEKYLKDHGT